MKSKKMLSLTVFPIVLAFSIILPISAVGASVVVLLPGDHFISDSTADSSSAPSAIALDTYQGLVKPMVAASQGHIVGLKSDGTVVAVGSNQLGECNVGDWTDIVQVAAGGEYLSGHTVGLKSDGTVVAIGRDYSGQCDVGSWTNINQIAAGYSHTVGVKTDGTVVTAGSNAYGQCNVSDWTDIAKIATYSHTVGLKSDGTVVAIGYDEDGQCNVGDWADIIQVTAGYSHTVGLKSDGTVVAIGYDEDGRCNVGGWADIIQVAAGYSHTVGLRADGTVIAIGCTGFNYYGQCDVDTWTDIAQITAGYGYTVGLKSDGTIVIAGQYHHGQCDIGTWTDIVQVSVSWDHTVGLRPDGTVIAVGWNDSGQCNVDGFTDIIQVAAGGNDWGDFTAGLKSDGTVLTVGWHGFGGTEWDCSWWTDIVQIAAGSYHMTGLKNDGTVFVEGCDYAQCDVGDWADISQVAAGGEHTVGLKSNGTVVAAGYGNNDACDVDGWTGITQVAAGYKQTVGLKSDGTVVAAGDNNFGECDVEDWTDIIKVYAGRGYTLGLKSNGTVVTAGFNDWGQCDVGGWTNIIEVAAGLHHTVGLMSNGTMVVAGAEIELAKILLLIKTKLNSPAEIRVCDTEGHMTGVMDGEVRDEILWAAFNQEDESISVLYGFDTYFYEVEGISSGTYGLTVDVLDEGQTTTFNVIDVPIATDTIHRYYIDWYALTEGEAGITIEKDYDGDGEIEEVIITGLPMLTNLSPTDNATGVSLDQELSWVVSDSGTVTCDIYFGTDTDPPLVSEVKGETTYVPTLNPDTTYYWRVTALNEYSILAVGALWKFTTEARVTPWPCFIATAAYGTPMADEVQTLREFRDEYLLTQSLGKALVEIYYQVSPPIAQFINDHPGLKPIVRAGLRPAVVMSTAVVNTTPAEKLATVSLLILVSVAAVAIWAMRWRSRYPEHT